MYVQYGQCKSKQNIYMQSIQLQTRYRFMQSIHLKTQYLCIYVPSRVNNGSGRTQRTSVIAMYVPSQ